MSMTAKALNLAMRTFPTRKLLLWVAKNPPRRSGPLTPHKLAVDPALLVEERMIQDRGVVTVSKDDTTTRPRTHALVFHGGAYVLEAAPPHWKLLEALVGGPNTRATLVDYPLAPESTFRETFSMVEETYATLVEEYPDDRFCFVGDSAGGGLALAFNQRLIASGNETLPAKTVLLSPWLDMTLANPECAAAAKKDAMLSPETLHYCAELYAGGADLSSPSLSPIHGPLDGLPPTLLLYSNDELFTPDCRRFEQKASDVGLPGFESRSFDGMPHDWLLMPIPEARALIDDVVAFIAS